MKDVLRLIGLSLTGLILVCPGTMAQFEASSGYYAGALLFGQTNWGGTARIQAIGGSQMSLGGDLSSISGNPAGLGFYNRSEIGITPALNFSSTQSGYLDADNNSSKTHFNIGNLGAVFRTQKPIDEESIWKGGSFGFSYNRMSDFHQEIFYGGFNNTNDFLDYVLEDINNYGYDEEYYLHVLPYDTYLINDFAIDEVTGDTIDGRWSTFVELPAPGQEPYQSEEIITSGSQDKWSFSYGGNVYDRFYFGFGLGVTSLTYKNETIYREKRYEGSILDNYNLSETLKINGVGVNMSFGAIIRPVNILTVGISYTTPTVYGITDEFSTSMESVWRDEAFDFYGDDDNFTGDQYTEWDVILSEYSMYTPGRLNTGVTFFFNKNGFITSDLEFVDYSKTSLSGEDFSFESDNENIRELFRNTINFRIGGEYRYKDLRARAGYSYSQDPYRNVDKIDRSKSSISGGIGYRGKVFYTDFTVVHSSGESIKSPYQLEDEEFYGPNPVASFDNYLLSFILSIGFYFN